MSFSTRFPPFPASFPLADRSIRICRHDRDFVIAATHGKRAIDNLKQFKPHLKDHELPSEVQSFEETILAFADEFQTNKQRRLSRASSFASMSSAGMSTSMTPSTSNAGSQSSSRRPSTFSEETGSTDRFDFGFGRNMFGMTPMPQPELVSPEELQRDLDDMWEAEDDLVDRSVQILPGVRRMIDSIPEGRYCVATSGAKTYGKLTSLSTIFELDALFTPPSSLLY